MAPYTDVAALFPVFSQSRLGLGSSCLSGISGTLGPPVEVTLSQFGESMCRPTKHNKIVVKDGS